MNANELTGIDQVRDFPAGTQRVAFEVAVDKQSRYDRVRRTLVKFHYSGCGKSDNGEYVLHGTKAPVMWKSQITTR